MTLHQERTHPEYVEGCFGCKISSVKIGGTAALRREREGTDVTDGKGTATYVKEMYAKMRAAGRPDPRPQNKKAARYAPAAGPLLRGSKKYKEANNGL